MAVCRNLVKLGAAITVGLFLNACASGGGGTRKVLGNEGGSDPNNEKESIEYQQAVVRCHKSGGTRIVKITGDLRCF